MQKKRRNKQNIANVIRSSVVRYSLLATKMTIACKWIGPEWMMKHTIASRLLQIHTNSLSAAIAAAATATTLSTMGVQSTGFYAIAKSLTLNS